MPNSLVMLSREFIYDPSVLTGGGYILPFPWERIFPMEATTRDKNGWNLIDRIYVDRKMAYIFFFACFEIRE